LDTNKLTLLSLLFLCLSVFIQPAGAELLQGGVQHKEFLPQMPSEVQPGSTYLQGQAQATSIVWYPLPRWLMGVFESDFITNQVVQVYSPAAPRHASSGRLQHTEGFGVQLDKTGRAWHADFLPHKSIWQGSLEEIQTTLEKECTFTNDDKLVLHIHNHCVYVNPATQVIDHVEQVDGFKTITLKDDQGDLAIYDDIQEYDSNGKPLDRYIATSTMQRIRNFEPLDFKNGIDLRASLARHLVSIGRSDLIPAVGNETQSITSPSSTFPEASGPTENQLAPNR
jgi:hypothetical protein